MLQNNSFHEIRFPVRIAFGAAIAPERRTEVISLGSGFEERNTRWAHSRRQYDAGQGVRTIDDLHDIIDFFEERRGQLYGFRWHDRIDCRSCAPSKAVSAFDQVLGHGDGVVNDFQLIKTYGELHAPYQRLIQKPLASTVQVAVNDVLLDAGDDFSIDDTTGIITFLNGAPATGAQISAGYEFDVPVRFAVDRLDINLSTFAAGDIPSIPLVEVRL
ncbi:MAG: DUF2460 domain-containing protein [Hyphomicrobiales bacterium]